MSKTNFKFKSPVFIRIPDKYFNSIIANRFSASQSFYRNMGLPNVRFHDLRHSYAVAALHAGDDGKTLQTNLGHHTAVFTLDVYGHATDQMKKESSKRMDRFIEDLVK